MIGPLPGERLVEAGVEPAGEYLQGELLEREPEVGRLRPGVPVRGRGGGGGLEGIRGQKAGFTSRLVAGL